LTAGFYLQSPSERATQSIERLQNIDSRRIADMDATGISMQILSLTSPGVQVFDAATAVSFARDSNDQLAAAMRHWMFPCICIPTVHRRDVGQP